LWIRFWTSGSDIICTDPSIIKQKRKTSIFTVLCLFLNEFSSQQKTDVMSLQKVISKNPLFFVGILKATDERSSIRSGSVNQWYGSVDPDPYH
jgi:hypothetical protein